MKAKTEARWLLPEQSETGPKRRGLRARPGLAQKSSGSLKPRTSEVLTQPFFQVTSTPWPQTTRHRRASPSPLTLRWVSCWREGQGQATSICSVLSAESTSSLWSPSSTLFLGGLSLLRLHTWGRSLCPAYTPSRCPAGEGSASDFRVTFPCLSAAPHMLLLPVGLLETGFQLERILAPPHSLLYDPG